MNETSGQGQAALVRGGIEFDARDVTLLREIGETASVAKASSNLGRSRSRDLSRIEELEAAFGPLVERRRGGASGGGSQLTDNATQLLNQYERLQAAVTATAQVPETVLNGMVTTVSGELADVATEVGTIRGLHDGVAVDEFVQVRIDADAITLLDPNTDLNLGSTSARNRLAGKVTDVQRGKTVYTIDVDVRDVNFLVLVTKESVDRLGLETDRDVVITWKATATRLTNIFTNLQPAV